MSLRDKAVNQILEVCEMPCDLETKQTHIDHIIKEYTATLIREIEHNILSLGTVNAVAGPPRRGTFMSRAIENTEKWKNLA